MVFTPKKLSLGDSGENAMAVRGTMLGACFAENYNKLPKTGHRFVVTEIGGDWAWFRFFFQFERHWNSLKLRHS